MQRMATCNVTGHFRKNKPKQHRLISSAHKNFNMSKSWSKLLMQGAACKYEYILLLPGAAFRVGHLSFVELNYNYVPTM